MNISPEKCWAKTTQQGEPGVSVLGHCMNVGCVAEELIEALHDPLRKLLPAGAATLAALHDIGKISTGFQRKCPVWLSRSGLAQAAIDEFWQGAEPDHSKVSQAVLHDTLKAANAQLWAVAVGAHHGRVHGKNPLRLNRTPQRIDWENAARQQLVQRLFGIFGPLPSTGPGPNHAALWLLAGMIVVADWLGSNEYFFSPTSDAPHSAAKARARKSLETICWGGGRLNAHRSFSDLFGISSGPNTLQECAQNAISAPGLLIVEGPMGCGKTEAALAAAHHLITGGANQGFYFGLPTQATSNRIHQRVGRFLKNALEEGANYRLAHGASWLHDNHAVQIHPAVPDDDDAAEHIASGRSWFASSRHALLARYGVGTVDQALQAVVAVKHFFVRRFGLAGKVVILDEVHSYDVYTGALLTQLVRELLALRCTVIILSATLTRARRSELLAAAGAKENDDSSPQAYPLITVAEDTLASKSILVAWEEKKTIALRVDSFTEHQIASECLERAASGQHVLYLRNTVVEAQAAYSRLASGIVQDGTRIALLHSRFPYFRREQLESEWLERLGRQRVNDQTGSILVATQVVEQSVDLDLDFIVTDLAPTDMLLQRMGRLWRHARPVTERKAARPDFWINVPPFDAGASAEKLKKFLGRSGRVYAPYVLLRTAEVLAGRHLFVLPDQIREVLEATYAEREEAAECAFRPAMTVIVANDTPDAIRGMLKRWFIEPRPNTFVGTLNVRTHAKVMEYIISQSPKDFGMLIISTAPNCQGYQIERVGPCGCTGRKPVTISGVPLVAEAWVEPEDCPF